MACVSLRPASPAASGAPAGTVAGLDRAGRIPENTAARGSG